jgi:hypothetical protein
MWNGNGWVTRLGEALPDRVKRDGSVPIEQALSIAKQITGRRR